MHSAKTIIGIMTGTSLDGVDLAICRFRRESGRFHFDELFFNIYEYPQELKDKLYDIISGVNHIYDISQVNFAMSKLFAGCAEKAMKESGIGGNEIDAVGIHGQTLWHQPKLKPFTGMMVSSTYQAGNIAALSAMTDLPVIGDFRSADVAAGGQGAPLVPVFDFEFLRSETRNIISLNIGGISNITVLPRGCNRNEVAAFDTGPGNMLIDLAAKKYFGKAYDKNGEIARSGRINYSVLEELLAHPYISKRPPKSTGRELFNALFLNKYFPETIPPEDVIATLTQFTAASIAHNIKMTGITADKLIISGGGARNLYLVEKLRDMLSGTEIITSDKAGIGIDSKEAVCFAFLAYLNLLGIPGNIRSVTGASKDIVLGVRAG